MPTVLDSFVVELGLDGRQFEQGERDAMVSFQKTKEAATSMGKTLEEHAGKAADLFSVAKKGALGLVAAFAGAEVAGFINNVVAMDASTGRLAHSLGQSTERLSKWEGMVRMVGGSSGDAQRVFAGVTDTLNNYAMTTGTLPPTMMALMTRAGISPNDFMKNPDAAWDKISDFMVEQNKLQPGLGRWWAEQIPGMTESFMNLLQLGSKGMDALKKRIEELGYATRLTVEEAADLQAKTVGMDVAFEQLARRTFPALIWMATQLAKVLDAFTGTFKGADEIADAVKKGDWKKAILGEGGGTVFGAHNWSEIFDMMRGRGPGGAGAPGAGGQLGSNWENFLSGLSFLETDQRNIGNRTSSAQGYFQFLNGTAKKATAAGLPDPRIGNWSQQADATMQYIKKFYPQAAAAINSGDFVNATMMLRGEWPSLPGGIQSQSEKRYRTWADVLHGGGPRPPGESFDQRWGAFPPGAGSAARGSSISNSTSNKQSSVDVKIGTVVVQTQSKDADGIYRDAASGLRKNLIAAMPYNTSLSG
jgi:hypothetical protein